MPKWFKFQPRMGAAIITRPCDGVDYLARWKILKIFGWELKLHVFLADDNMDPHDHPFSFLSLHLLGRYTEHVFDPEHPRSYGHATVYHYKAGTIHWRKADTIHMITIPDGPAVTLVLTTPRWRKWGFITKMGWKSVDEYNPEHGICD